MLSNIKPWTEDTVAFLVILKEKIPIVSYQVRSSYAKSLSDTKLLSATPTHAACSRASTSHPPAAGPRRKAREEGRGETADGRLAPETTSPTALRGTAPLRLTLRVCLRTVPSPSQNRCCLRCSFLLSLHPASVLTPPWITERLGSCAAFGTVKAEHQLCGLDLSAGQCCVASPLVLTTYGLEWTIVWVFCSASLSNNRLIICR